MSNTYTQQISSSVSGVSTQGGHVVDQSKLKIAVLDNGKIPYDEAIKNVDRNLQNIIVETNDTLEKVRDEYQKRIDDQNCRSDLFWRVTGISSASAGPPGSGGSNTQLSYTCTCVKLSPTYPKVENSGTMPYVGTGASDPSTGQLVLGDDGLPQGSYATGFSTSSMMWFKGSTGVGAGITADIDVIDMGDGDPLTSAGSDFDAYLEPDNLHGLLLYREPYSRDILDSFVATGVGTISAGIHTLTLLTNNLRLGIKPGQIITSSRSNTFASPQGNIVVGISSTTMDLSSYSDIVSVGTTTVSTVPLITLQDPAVNNVVAPGTDGDYTYFDFTVDPNTISDRFSVSTDQNPYVPQTITLIDRDSNFGKGIKIKYINNGQSTATQEWNAFLEGLPDPNQDFEKIDDKDDIVEVEHPKIGAGKIYYPIGFDQKPILLGGGNASEGDVRIFDGNVGLAQQAYASLSGCNDSDLNAAISVRNTAEAALSGSNSFPEKISIVNSVRTKRNEINLAIWAYRSQIGKAHDDVDSNNSFMNNLNTSPYANLMNTGTE